MTKHFFSESDIDNFVQRYEAGESVKSIADSIGVTDKVISMRLARRGVSIRHDRSHSFSAETERAIIECFKSGVGVGGVSDKLGLGVSHSPIARVLKKNGINTRNRSEQQFARMARSTPEQIAALTKAAHDAARGRVAQHSEIIKRAKAMAGVIRSEHEAAVVNALNEAGIECLPGFPVDRYNVDVVVGRVAVEVFGGGWSFSDKKRIARYVERTKKIADFGFNTIFIVTGKRFMPIDYSHLISAINEFNSDPSATGQYRVIWGGKDGLSGNCDELNEDAFICPFVNVRDVTTGRYISVPR